MKKTLLFAGLALALAGTAHANEENTGCGLGTMIFDGQKGIVPQVLAVTTNGTLGNQTFGITSGTLGCTQDGVVKSSAKLAMFTGANLASLASDMAAGQGETLASMAELMGVEEQDKAHFYATTKENFAKIFPSEQLSTSEVLANLNGVLSQDATLSRYVITA